MNLETLQSISLAVAQERNVNSVLLKIVNGLVDQGGIALARIWLIGPGDLCPDYKLRSKGSDPAACLQLVASAGKPVCSPGEDWSRLNGEYSRIPVGYCKIGGVGATGDPISVSDVSLNWITRKDFAEREQIRSFAAHPLIFQGSILGVLAVFSRIYLQEQNFLWLRHSPTTLPSHWRIRERSRKMRVCESASN